MQVNGKYIRGYGVPKYNSGSSQNTSSGNAGGSSSSGGINKTPKWVGKVTASSLNVRKWAGKEYSRIKSYPYLYRGNLVDVCDTVKAADGKAWYYIREGIGIWLMVSNGCQPYFFQFMPRKER